MSHFDDLYYQLAVARGEFEEMRQRNAPYAHRALAKQRLHGLRARIAAARRQG